MTGALPVAGDRNPAGIVGSGCKNGAVCGTGAAAATPGVAVRD